MSHAATVTKTYLEMTEPGQHRAKHVADGRFRILEARVPQWQLNRFLYELVGEPWQWRDRLVWSDERWRRWAEDENVRTFVAYYDGSPAGYFELHCPEDNVEIAYFGLAPKFIGRGFGGALLTRAIEEAWRMKPRSVCGFTRATTIIRQRWRTTRPGAWWCMTAKRRRQPAMRQKRI